jgi:CheY-like chemotaxis protein
MRPAPPPGALCPILVVAEDAAVRRFLVWALTDEGCAVLEAPYGAAALARAREAAPGLILLDMRMLVMDGWEFARCYRALAPPGSCVPQESASSRVAGTVHDPWQPVGAAASRRRSPTAWSSPVWFR